MRKTHQITASFHCFYLILYLRNRHFSRPAIRLSCLHQEDLTPPQSHPLTLLSESRFTSALTSISNSASENNVQTTNSSKRSFSMVAPSHLASSYVPKSSSMSDLDYESAIYALLSQQDPFYDRTPWFSVVGR